MAKAERWFGLATTRGARSGQQTRKTRDRVGVWAPGPDRAAPGSSLRVLADQSAHLSPWVIVPILGWIARARI